MSEQNQQRVNELVEWIAKEVKDFNPRSVSAFLEGIWAFASSWSIWKDGDRNFGSKPYTTRELNEAIKKFTESQK